MLRDEVARYTELSGNDGLHTPIGIIGAYLDGYEKGRTDAQPKLDENTLSEQQESDKLGVKTGETCTDCISRQAAIEAICEHGTRLERRGITVLAVANHKQATVDLLESLPSAQPGPIRINLNEPIKVKLTDWGKEIYYHQYDRINQIAGREICKPMFPKENENGYTEFQLWCFIQLYGKYIGMAMPNVIEPLEIVYER